MGIGTLMLDELGNLLVPPEETENDHVEDVWLRERLYHLDQQVVAELDAEEFRFLRFGDLVHLIG
jgi:hypothetical protein